MTTGKHVKLALSETDLVLLNNALNEILNGPDAIAEWEFQTRTGAERSEAVRLLRRNSDTIDGGSPQ